MDSDEQDRILLPGPGLARGRAWAARSPRPSPRRWRSSSAASEASGLDLKQLCFEAPLEDLVETEVQQPALVATSLACSPRCGRAGIEPDYVVGHSVGEFAALAAASVADAARGDRARARARARDGRGGASSTRARWRRSSGSTTRSSRRSAGRSSACGRRTTTAPARSSSRARTPPSTSAARRPRSAGARRTVKLKVSGAFHSPLVARAADRLRPAVERVKFREPIAPFMSTVTAKIEPAQRIGTLLVDQLTAPVSSRRPRASSSSEGVQDVRRGRSGQRPLRPREADRPERQDDLGQQPRRAGEARGDRLRRRDVLLARGQARRSSPAARAGSGARSRSSSAGPGASVVVGYRSGAEEAEAVASEIGGRAVQADVSDPAEAQRARRGGRRPRHPRQQRGPDPRRRCSRA